MAPKTAMKNEAWLSKLLEGYDGNSELYSMHMKKKNVKEVKGLPISVCLSCTGGNFVVFPELFF